MDQAYRAPLAQPGAPDFRQAGHAALAQALLSSRRDTLATFDCFESALASAGLAVPYSPELNPPLWELGHVGWFQRWWLGRNPQRHLGVAADPQVTRMPATRSDADALHDSSRVPHASRWHLPQPSAQATRDELAQGLAESLQLLEDTPEDDTALYFHRLCLAHEDMHHEAAIYTAQALGIALDDPRWQAPALPAPAPALTLPATPWSLGHSGAGFAFDNELGAHEVSLPECHIDSQVLRWADYLPFVQDGGYAQARWWPGAAGVWRATQASAVPRYLRQNQGRWEQQNYGHWRALDLSLPACHLSAFEAQAWCAWAGRRLPNEAQWERAAVQEPQRFAWGAVWEWTASNFTPYPGFTPHPYRDYSAPWFGSRTVLRGASFATQPRLHHARYRNYFTPERNDIYAGFRTCSL